VSTLSIVIVSYNAREDLVRCLESLHAAPPRTPHDITLVDNASTDSLLVRTVRERWPGVRVLVQDRNRGFAAGTNTGIRASQGQLVLLLNSDTVAPPGAIDRLIERLEATPPAVAAGPRLVDVDGRAELSFGRMISPLAEVRQRAIGGLYAAGVPAVTSWIERETRREQFVDWVSGACLLVSRRAAEAAGLLDERFFMYTEDVDFCAALRALGGRILFAPAAEIVHARGRSRASEPMSSNVAYRRSQIAFYEKHHPGWLPVLRAYLALKGELPRE
jgi:GT2 family glycosyltransferase